METKIYSSAGFSHHYSVEELYVLTRHWLSDIKFFEQEITFLQSFILKFVASDTELSLEEQLMDLERGFEGLNHRIQLLKAEVLEHQNKLSLLLDKNRAEEYEFNKIQSTLEGEFFDFIKSYRQVKFELFGLSQPKKRSLIA